MKEVYVFLGGVLVGGVLAWLFAAKVLADAKALLKAVAAKMDAVLKKLETL